MSTYKQGFSEILTGLLAVSFPVLLVAGVSLVREIIGVQETEEVIEKVKFTSETKYH